MKPTDDELEAQAMKFSQAAELSCFLSNDEYRRTAAMLRTCKGRDTWNAAIEAVGRLRGRDVQKRDAEDIGEAYDLAIDEAQDAIRADLCTPTDERVKALMEAVKAYFDALDEYDGDLVTLDRLRAAEDAARAALRDMDATP